LRLKGLFTDVAVDVGGFDANYTAEEISYLSQKLIDRGLDNTKPFAIQRYSGGKHRGIYRVVRLLTGEDPDPTKRFTPVKPSVEFRAFLDTLD
jgi:hypothetical protein